ARAGLHTGDEILSINDSPVAGQRDVMFDLLDAVSSRGGARMTVRGNDGKTRVADLDIPDRDERVRLTEPAALLQGLGFDFWQPPQPSILGEVTADGPAARAGLRTGDQIVAINGQPVSDFRQLVSIVSARPGENVSFTYRRGGVERTVRIAVMADKVGDKVVGRIRVAQGGGSKYPDSMVMQIHLAPLAALSRAAEEAWSMTALQGRLFWRMVLGQFSMKNLNG